MTADATFTHTPVLVEETLRALDLRPGDVVIDATVGLGGHSEAIAERIGPAGRLLCIDQDGDALDFARERLRAYGRRCSFSRANFRAIDRVAHEAGFGSVDAILLDLGISSMQIQRPERGFAFALEGPLDMRMDREGNELTAGVIVNTWSEGDLADLFFRLGEEPAARRIARAIVNERPLNTTWELARCVERATGSARGRTKTHPATKAFLALRIRVNRELDSVSTVLPLACDLLNTPREGRRGGRLAVISFHSLEDRIVKQYFRRESTQCVCPPGLPVCRCGHVATLREVARRGIKPSEQEIAANPRARSAVLRAVERIGGTHGDH